jgi:hypothetical protein
MSLEQQLAQSSEVKGLGLAELVGKDLIMLEPNPADFWDVGSRNMIPFAKLILFFRALLVR